MQHGYGIKETVTHIVVAVIQISPSLWRTQFSKLLSATKATFIFSPAI